MKREIAYEFDNLPFEFKDPWAVSQDTTGDSSQTIHDFYREQVTPYEPWNDLGSLGVFLNVDRFGTLHYGTKYWRYYDYDSGSDSYDMKDDANLEEGDLINMDEILYGKGTEVSPTGSIEQTRVTPGDEPYREYRLEYKDPDNTMDFTAVYKAHMLTDHTSQPTKYSNQRKIDIDPRGMYHLVYESAGEVWYVNSEDGRRWSREELVSDYSHSAVNPSLAVYDSCVYVTYVENGDVMMKCRHKGNWQEPAPVGLKKAGYNNGTETTPVVAVGGTCYPNDGHIVVVVWDDHQFLRSNMLYLKYEFPYVDTSGQSVHRADTVTVNATNYPVYPSITCDDQMTEYTVCWREGSDIKCSEIHVGGGTCDQDKFYSYTTVSSIADASLASDTCVFAPSVTRDHNNNPVVAYEVRQAGWIYSDRWVNVRTYDGNSRSWNTTAYQMPYYSATGYGEAIAPSVGAHETTTSCGGNPEPGLRVAFHKNWGGGIRIGVIDCQYSEYAQISDGESYPSVVPFASNGSLRETYSAPHQVGPFTNAIRSTNSYLTKQATQNIRMVRDLRLQIGNDLALLGVTDLARRHGNNVLDEISWHAMPDSLVIGYDGEAHEILYTEPFSVTNGDHIDYRGILYCTDAPSMPAGVSIAVQLRKASDGSIVRSFSIPLRNLPSDTAIWTSWSRPLTQAPAFPVYLSLGIEGILPSGAVIGNAKVWLEDQYIPKMNVNESATLTLPNDFVLEPNHPNPFNPSTTISFALGLDGHVRLSVFNAVGKEVARLVNEERIAGRYQETFHAEDLPSGNYIARLVFGGKMQSQNMMLVK
ncbi:MAG: T9SS type A sorting domain-containing protein [Bacteroidetes bacterium]|nr:T9SS type A sorting domain-containing protein [Bacteroidota bacterium]